MASNIHVSTKLANTWLDCMGNSGATHAATNFDSGNLDIRDGTQPGPDSAVAGTLISQVPLPADAFGVPATRSMAKAGTWEDSAANATGTPTHFRLKRTGDTDGADTTTWARIEGTCGSPSGYDLNLDSASITINQKVTINTFTWSYAA